MNPHDQRNLVHYLIERIELDEEGEVRMWMLGENPEPQKVNRPVRKFSQGGEWLPERDSIHDVLLPDSQEDASGRYQPDKERWFTG